MRLSDFILDHMEEILQTWVDFARTVQTPLPAMDTRALRNDAEYILKAVALDMCTSQTEQQQIDKSTGHGPVNFGDTPAQEHAVTRLMAGFTMDQLVSEYRALRSSVLRLWLGAYPLQDDHQVRDIIRFNEAIDQALGESISAYSQAVEVTRKTVLGVLGHDLRSPLGAVQMAGDFLRRSKNLGPRELSLANQISSSVGRASQMVDDLLDLARCNLGAGIPVNLEPCDLVALCIGVLDELRTAFPEAKIELSSPNAVLGQYDPSRMAQVFSNLVGNAIRHGDAEKPVLVSLRTTQQDVAFVVQNSGDVIPPSALPHLFDPGRRYSTYASVEKGAPAGLGLGLFIAAEIAAGHGGKIGVVSTPEDGTVFRVSLPLGVSVSARKEDIQV